MLHSGAAQYSKSMSINLCVPGMGMILWGASPLYIIWEDVTLVTVHGLEAYLQA